MGHWSRLVSTLGGDRLVAVWGGLYVFLATARAGFVVATGRPTLAAVVDFLLVGGPGAILLYGGLRLPGSDLDPETYPRVAAWCVAGFVATLGVIELLYLEPGVTIAYPRWSFTLGAAVGTAAGFGIGVNDARAVTRAKQVERRNRELERQNGRLESFARMVAHELRSPLTIAKIYLDRTAEGDADAAAEVERALDRIEEMIEVVLVTARGSDASIDAEPVSIADVATEAWATLDFGRADLVVETDRTVLADPIHVRHLLENLFKNAVEHGSTDPRSRAGADAEDGSGDRRPRDPDAPESGVTVRVGSLPGGFYVEDDGPGIPEDEREAVFEAGHTTDEDGIGLGLTFVSQLVDAYGWDCAITEGEAGGARFEFTNVDTVPAAQRAA
ncbi:ATP-binding protein [Halorussus sp. AFM4]|uniref:ATP-binding protein n=1 Tax=Halorussus sp. AFM4 TaxID=3421651 RepID=UPI003EC07566